MKYNAGDIINVNSSEGDVKTLYVTIVNEEDSTITGGIMSKKYTEVVPFDNIINVVEESPSTSIRTLFSLGEIKYV